VDFVVKAYFFVERFILLQAFSYISDFDAEVKLFERQSVEIELALFRLNRLLADCFTEELSRMQELLEQETR